MIPAAALMLLLPLHPQGIPLGSTYQGSAAAVPSVVNTCGTGAFGTNPSASFTYGTGGSGTCANTSTPTSGDILTVFIYGLIGTPTIATPSGCATWTLVQHDATNDQSIYVGSASSSGSCTVTESTTSSSNASVDVVGYDVSHALTTTDGSNSALSAFCTSCSGPSITTTVNGDMVLSVTVESGTSHTDTVSSPFTQDYFSQNASSGDTQLAGHDLQATAGAINMSWTDSSGNNFYTLIVGLKP